MSTPPPPPGENGPSDPGQPYGSDPSGAGSPDYSSQPPPGGPSYQGDPGYYGGAAGGDRDNNLGVIALVTGILSLIVCPLLGIASIVYGRKAQTAQASGTANNGTLGTVGFWLGVAAIVLWVLAIILLVGGVLTLGALDSGTT